MEELHIPEEITTLGAAVRWARKRRGMRQHVLALRMGFTASYLCRIEKGTASTTYQWKFARELGVPLEELTARSRGVERVRARPHVAETRQVRTCGLCRKRDHLTADCPLKHRSPRKFCRDCMGLPHRRPRVGFCECGKRYEAEPALRAESTPRSIAGYAFDMGDKPHLPPSVMKRRRQRKAAA